VVARALHFAARKRARRATPADHCFGVIGSTDEEFLDPSLFQRE